MTTGFDLDLSPRQEMMQTELHAIARSDFRAKAAAAERDGADLGALEAQLEQVGIAPAQLLEAGRLDPTTLIVAVSELAYGDPGLAWAAVPALQLASVLAACGTENQREAARRILESDRAATASVLLYEDFGRQPSEYETTVTAARAGWTASGTKTSVAHPGAADISLLVARDVADDQVAAFCFAGERDGLTLQRDDRQDGKVGVTAVPSGAVALSSVKLTADERLEGDVGLDRAIGQARLLLAAALLGTARASIEFCSGYAQYRTSWGKPLVEYQAVSFPLIEHATEIEEVRLLLWDTASRLDQLHRPDIERSVARAINRASSLGLRATRDGVQLIGVRGITRDLPVERWYRDAAVLAAIDFDVLQTPLGLN